MRVDPGRRRVWLLLVVSLTPAEDKRNRPDRVLIHLRRAIFLFLTVLDGIEAMKSRRHSTGTGHHSHTKPYAGA